MQMTINTHSLASDDTVVVIHISGSIDSSNAINLEHVFNEQVAKGNTKLVADVANVHYISSSDLRAFLGSVRASREKNVAEVSEISGLAELFVFCDDVEAAGQRFNP